MLTTIRSETKLTLLAALFLSAPAAAGMQSEGQVDDSAASLEESEASAEGVDAPSLDRFRAVAAQRLGTLPELIELSAVEGPVRLFDGELVLFVANAVFGDDEKVAIALDASGQPFDLRAMLALDAERASALRGKLDRRLGQELSERPDGLHDVVVWLDAPELEELRIAYAEIVDAFDADGRATQELVEFHHAELAREIAAAIGSVTETAAARFRNAGFEVLGADTSAPVITLRTDASGLALLQADPDVKSLNSAGTGFEERLDVARQAVRAHVVPTGVGGATGAGVRVAVVEGTRACPTNPYLSIVGTRLATGATGNHTTGVASCIASTHPVHRGIAPGASILSANGVVWTSNSTTAAQFQTSIDAITWGISAGAPILNLSYGAGSPGPVVSAFDRYLDYVARNSARTFTIACGNSGNFAGDPGAGYNAVAVGNFRDNGSSSWSDDAMSSSSSWRNPSTGLETPQVAAPGTSIQMGGCSWPWNTYLASGTSFSAPIVAGIAALMIEKRPALRFWPEAVRAILMATAWNNIEGASSLSSRDGAGGVDARAAYRVTARGNASHRFGTLTPSMFSGSALYTAQSTYAYAGEKVRAVLAWDSKPDGGPTYSNDNLKADFDLYVYRPTGLVVGLSYSTLNSFEVVEFTAPETGYYTLKIRRRYFTSTSEYFGTAMSRDSDI